MPTHPTTQKSKLALVLVVTLLVSPSALGVFTYQGGQGNGFFTTDLNWVGGTAPLGAITDSIAFGSDGVEGNVITLADTAVSAISSIDFSGADAGYTISGTGSWSLDSGATFGGTSGFAHDISVNIISNGAGIDFNGTDDLTLGGIISGAGITKSGASTLTLTGANTYTDATTLSAGAIVLGNDSALSSVGLSVTGNAAIQSDNNARSISNAVAIGDGVTLTYSGAFDLALGGNISGATGTLEVTGSSLTLSGTNSHGTTDLNGGAIVLGSDSALGGGLTVTASGTISSNNDARSVATDVSIGGGQTLTVDGTNNMALTGVISGTGALTKSNTSVLTLSGTNTYSGNTTLNAGTIILGNDSALGAGTMSVGGDSAIQSNDNARSVATDITVGGGLTLTVSGASDLALTGSLSGAGTVSKDGAGTLTLSGGNTQGTTELLAGTIVLGSDTALGSGLTVTTSGTIQSNNDARSVATDMSLVAGQTLTVSGTNNLILSGVLSGAGALTKSGTSTLTLSGVNTYTGLTTLSAGTLNLSGQLAGSVQVDGGILMGTGTVGDAITDSLTINSGGRLAPGNSIGTTVVSGDFILASGATLEIEVEKAPGPVLSSDLVDVGGSATLQAGSTIEVTDISAVGQVINTGDTFTIIQTVGGVTDNTPTITSLSAGLDFAGSVIGFNYVLQATRNALSTFATTSNNAALLAAIDSDSATAAGDYADVINELGLLTANELNDAAEQLSPVTSGSVATLSARTNQLVTANLAGYLRNRRLGLSNYAGFKPFSSNRPEMYADASFSPQMLSQMLMQNANTATPETDGEWHGFAQPYGLYYDQDSTDEIAGLRARSAGGMFGVDTDVADNLIVGFGGGYSYTCLDFDSDRGDGHINSFYVGPYATWYQEDYFVDASLALGYYTNKLHRDINFGGIDRTADSDYDAYDLSAYVGGGLNYYLDEWTATPTASIQYSRYCADGFKETGAGAAGLDVDATNYDSLRSRLGIELSTVTEIDRATAIPELFVGWQHEFLNNNEVDARFVNGVAEFTTDISDGEDSVYYGAGLSALLSEDVSAFVRYEGECYSGNQTNAVTAGVTFLF